MVLFETMELPMSLAGVVSMSPAKRSPPAASVIRSAAILERPSKSQKVTRKRWAEDMEWICFRTTDPGNHIGTTLEKINEVDPSCPVPKDPRRYCKFCTYTVRDGEKVMHHSYFANEKPKKNIKLLFSV
mmetsp:Transcript_31422/g.56938  ORF Transcript_31422/g.56938 Transcript_31422/m.56938 type:complete len:129 (-) Transcript_31422:157-543(-)